MKRTGIDYVWALLRLGIGWIFFWSFFDKVFGLGFSTVPGKAWLDGVSPTLGFLKFATKGPFASLYQSIAGYPLVDWLFMLGLLLIGIALLLGIGMKIACFSGVLMYLLMYTAGFIPPEHNPFLDEHILFPLVLIGAMLSHAGSVWGFGAWWSQTALVKRYRFLE